jgi:hypothetical protein
MAEHVLRLVTPGTHTWSKYVNADEVHAFFRDDLKWLPQHGASCLPPGTFLHPDRVGVKEHRAVLQRPGGYSSTLSPPDGVYYLVIFLARWMSTISSGYDGPSHLNEYRQYSRNLILFVRKHKPTLRIFSRPVLLSVSQLHATGQGYTFQRPPSIETQGMKNVQPPELSQGYKIREP